MSIHLQLPSMLRVEPEFGKLKVDHPKLSALGKVFWSPRISVPGLQTFFLRRFSSWCHFRSQIPRGHSPLHRSDLMVCSQCRVGDLAINSIETAREPTEVG